MSTAKAGVKSDPPTVKIEPVKNKDGTDKKGKDGKRQYDVPADLVRNIIKNNTIQNPEAPRYIELWGLKDNSYRNVSPGENLVDMFLDMAQPKKNMTIIDWGCGTGRAAKKMYEDRREFDITMVDFAYNCLDEDVKKLTKNNDRFRFFEEDLTVKTDLQSEYGFCTDVMEHIPTEDVDKVLANILYASKHVFFQISTAHDIFSEHPDLEDDADLHLTVKGYHWWLRKFSDQCVIVNNSIDIGNAVIFYVSGWGTNALNWEGGYVNTDLDVVKQNIIDNSKLGIQPILPHGGDGETEVMLLCGGPTLNDFEDEIKEHRANGVKCITVNGTYNWCIERGIKPSLQCMIDARPFMLRMVEQVPGVTDETKYAISSQCNPEIFSKLPHDRTYMWQVSISNDLIPVIKEHYGEMYEDWFPSPGGSTVGLRALMLIRMLGFNKIHVYGMDSCVFPDRHHHAYEQKENDYLSEKGTIPIVIGDGTRHRKVFQCQPWQAFQAREFEMMVPHMADDTQLQVHGDGLIAYLIKANALHAEDEEVT